MRGCVAVIVAAMAAVHAGHPLIANPSSERPRSIRTFIVYANVNAGIVLSMETPGLDDCPYPMMAGPNLRFFKVVDEAGFYEGERVSPKRLQRRIRLRAAMIRHNQQVYRTRYDLLRRLCPRVRLSTP